MALPAPAFAFAVPGVAPVPVADPHRRAKGHLEHLAVDHRVLGLGHLAADADHVSAHLGGVLEGHRAAHHRQIAVDLAADPGRAPDRRRVADHPSLDGQNAAEDDHVARDLVLLDGQRAGDHHLGVGAAPGALDTAANLGAALGVGAALGLDTTNPVLARPVRVRHRLGTRSRRVLRVGTLLHPGQAVGLGQRQQRAERRRARAQPGLELVERDRHPVDHQVVFDQLDGGDPELGIHGLERQAVAQRQELEFRPQLALELTLLRQRRPGAERQQQTEDQCGRD